MIAAAGDAGAAVPARRDAGAVRARRSCRRSTWRPAAWCSTRRRGCSIPARLLLGGNRGAAVRIDIITIFPEYFGPLRVSLIGKAAERGDIQFGVHDLRGWAHDVHRTVDDTPLRRRARHGDEAGAVGRRARRCSAAGGAGLPGGGPRLGAAHPGGRAVHARQRAAGVRGGAVADLRAAAGTRASTPASRTTPATRMPVDEVSIGDYVLAGGEPAVLVMVEAIAGCCPACWATPSRRRTTRSARGSGPMARTARGTGLYPAAGLARSGRCRRSCCRAIMAAIARWRRDQALRRTAASQAGPGCAARPELR